MKKIFATLAFAAAATAASAQVYLGGSIGAWRDWDANKTSFTIAPEIGTVLSDKWEIGAALAYTYNYNNDVKTNQFSIAPYARWTFAQFDRVKLFLEPTAQWGIASTKVGDGDSETGNIWGVGVKPGLAVDLTSKLNFVAHVGFLGYRDSEDKLGLSNYNGAGFLLNGNDLSFGLSYNF